MAQLKPAAKILIGALIIAPLGYFGSKYLDKVPATQPAEPAVTQQVQPAEAPAQVLTPQQVAEQPTQEQQVDAPQTVTQPSSNAGIGALLNSGKK